MGSLFATVLLAVPLITLLGGIFLLDDPQLRSARFSNTPSGTSRYPQVLFSCNRHAPGIPSGCTVMDEVS